MNLNHEILVNNIAKETELLESLEWDYEVLDELYKYLDDIFKSFYLNEDIEYWYNKWYNQFTNRLIDARKMTQTIDRRYSS